MVAGCIITEEYAVAVSADRLWKVAFSANYKDALPKACVGFIDAVDIEGDGGPGSITTMSLSPAAAAATGAGAGVMRSQIVARDNTARVLKSEVLEGGKVAAQLKSQMLETRIEEAGEGACVVKLRVEYERLDGGGALALEDQAALTGAYMGLLKKVQGQRCC